MIATPRLTLVMPDARHVNAAIAFYGSDRAAARGWLQAPHEAWRNFATVIGHHTLRGFGPFVAEARDGTPIGLFGPWHPAGQPDAEIKWTIWNPDYEGQGYAAEAALACRTYAYETLGWTGAASYIRPDNLRSQRLARHLGATRGGTWTTPRGTLVEIWHHPAPDRRWP